MQIEDFSDKNKQTIEKFLQELVRSGLKPKSLVRYSIVMSWFSKTCDFSKITVEDTDKFFFFIIGKDISQMSKNFYWIRFRKFINWLRPDIDLTRYTIRYVEHSLKSPNEISTAKEISRLIQSAMTYRTCAMLSFQYDTGCRPQELRNLSRNDVMFDDKGMIAVLRGSKGERRIRVVTTMRSDEYLKDYLRRDPHAYPFKMCEENYLKLLKGTARRAGIVKKIYPYLLRHSRVTHLSPYISETVQCAYFGWVQGSDMPKVYNHASSEDVEKVLLKVMEAYD